MRYVHHVGIYVYTIRCEQYAYTCTPNYKTSSERGYNVSILCYPYIETLQVISKAKQSTTSISLNCYICLFTASLTSLNHIIAILYFVCFDDIQRGAFIKHFISIFHKALNDGLSANLFIFRQNKNKIRQ